MVGLPEPKKIEGYISGGDNDLNVTEVKLVQSEKAVTRIRVILLPIIIDVKRLQKPKANSPISITPSRVIIPVKFWQRKNALFPMCFTLSGTITVLGRIKDNRIAQRAAASGI